MGPVDKPRIFGRLKRALRPGRKHAAAKATATPAAAEQTAVRPRTDHYLAPASVAASNPIRLAPTSLAAPKPTRPAPVAVPVVRELADDAEYAPFSPRAAQASTPFSAERPVAPATDNAAPSASAPVQLRRPTPQWIEKRLLEPEWTRQPWAMAFARGAKLVELFKARSAAGFVQTCEHLNLASRGLTDSDIPDLCAVLAEASNLKSITLRDNGLSNDAAFFLRALKLRYLDLRQNRVNDNCLVALEDVKSLRW